jgi:carbon-monoxide dehydrogenase small subunit
MSATVDIRFKLNGVEQRVTVPAAMNTLEMLRDRLGLTGTKYGCGEGECGACTINVDGVTQNACLMFAADCDGRELITIEGLATSPIGTALRDSFTKHGAVQCGFCTPGILMQASHAIQKTPSNDQLDLERVIEGNLCRCTGYRKIIDSMAEVRDTLAVAEDA